MSDVEIGVDLIVNDRATGNTNKIKESLQQTGLAGVEAAKKLISNFNPAIGILEQLEAEAKRVKAALKQATTGEDIDAYKAKLSELLTVQQQLSSMGGQAANQTKSNFNGLQNSINQISRELPAFAISANTGFMAISNNIPILMDEIAKLKKANADLAASGQKGVPVWKQLASGLFSWGTALSLGVTLLTVYGKELVNFIGSLFKSGKAIDEAKERLKSLNEAVKGTDFKKAYTSIAELRINLDLAKKSMANKDAVVKQYNETIGETAGQVSDLDGVEKGLIANADNYVKMTLYKAAANLQLAKAAERAAEIQENSTKSASEFAKGIDAVGAYNANGGASGSMYGISNLKYDDYEADLKARAEKRKADREKELQDEQTAFENNGKALLEKAAEFAGKMGGVLNGGKSKPTTDKAVSDSYRNLLQRIADLQAEYDRKAMSRDDAEVQAVRDKFGKIAEEIKAFNADPKNKLKVDGSGLSAVMDRAIADLKYKQETERLKINLEQQKQLYAEFEEYKATFGEEAAKAKFKNQIDTEKSYLQQVQKLYALSIAQNTLSGGQGGTAERMTMYGAAAGAAEKAEEKKREAMMAEALKLTQSHEAKLLAIRKRYADLAASLGSTITEEDKTRLKQQADEEIAAANKLAFEKTAIYQQLSKDTMIYTEKALKEEIKALENLLKSADLPAGLRKDLSGELGRLKAFLGGGVDAGNRAALEEQKKNYEKALADPLIAGTAEAEKYRQKLIAIQQQIDGIDGTKFSAIFEGDTADVATKIADKLGALGNTFGEVAGSVSGLNEDLDYALGNIQSLIKVGQDGAKSIASFASGDIVGGVVSGVKAVAGLFSIGKKVKEMNAKARKEIEDFYAAAAKGEQEYQALLRKRELDEAGRNKNSYKAIVAQLELLKAQSPEVEAAYNKIFASLQGQQFVNGQGYQHGTWFRKAKTWDIMASLAGADYDRMEELYSQGKLKDKAKADFESLKALREELEKAGLQVEDLQEQLNQLLTGTNVDGLADGLMELFENGKAAAADFGQSFEDILRNAINNSFKEKMLKDALQPWYDDFAAMFVEGTPTDADLAALKERYTQIGEDMAKQLEAMGAIAGVSPGGKDADKNTLKGDFKSLTEETGSVLAGRMAGVQLAMVDMAAASKQSGAAMLAELREQTLNSMEIAANTLRTANNTERLAAIETALVSMDRKMSNGNNALRAAGG